MFLEKLVRNLFSNKNKENTVKEIYFKEVKNPVLAWNYLTIKD